jgi:murein endopeptidase
MSLCWSAAALAETAEVVRLQGPPAPVVAPPSGLPFVLVGPPMPEALVARTTPPPSWRVDENGWIVEGDPLAGPDEDGAVETAVATAASSMGEEGTLGDDDEDGEEDETVGTEGPVDGKPRYTVDLDDAALERLWRESPARLGSVSLGFTNAGRLLNGQPFPQGEGWSVVDRRDSFATTETIEYLKAAIGRVHAQFPNGDPIRVNDISREGGGWLRPHRSHQAGRDVDLSFYYRPGAVPRRGASRASIMDVARSWALVRALVTETDVQFILVDRRIQQVLHQYALSVGEDPVWLESLFHAGKQSILQHARRHRDHFHVRFYNPRAQELGRRLQPLMGKVRPEENVVMHRVGRRESLASIARQYGVAVSALRAANGLGRRGPRAGRTLVVPVRGPCTNCPLPPDVVVPPRRLPPAKPAVAWNPPGWTPGLL